MPDFQGYFASPKTCANRYYLKARRAKHATSSNKHSFWKAPPGGPVRAFVLAPLAFAHSAADRFWLADARQNRRNWRPLGARKLFRLYFIRARPGLRPWARTENIIVNLKGNYEKALYRYISIDYFYITKLCRCSNCKLIYILETRRKS